VCVTLQRSQAMFFVDGTWLFYSFFSRGRFRCPIINKFGTRSDQLLR
jgi:hypothetical protein